MVKHVLRIVSLGITALGAVLGLAANIVDDKRQDIKIEEKVNKKFEEKFGKEDEESEETDEEES